MSISAGHYRHYRVACNFPSSSTDDAPNEGSKLHCRRSWTSMPFFAMLFADGRYPQRKLLAKQATT